MVSLTPDTHLTDVPKRSQTSAVLAQEQCVTSLEQKRTQTQLYHKLVVGSWGESFTLILSFFICRKGDTSEEDRMAE